MKKQPIIFIYLIFFVILQAHAHLCDDVFIQAKDNLAVKVDVRDGELRIRDTGSFRVYLLNTMDRDIVDINLHVLSDEFDATVKPSSEWKNYPELKTNRNGGRKEFFEVELKRKPGTKAGAYKIRLELTGGSSKFKTIDFNDNECFVNIERTYKLTKTFWLGDENTIVDPVFYARFKLN